MSDIIIFFLLFIVLFFLARGIREKRGTQAILKGDLAKPRWHAPGDEVRRRGAKWEGVRKVEGISISLLSCVDDIGRGTKAQGIP